MMDRVEHIAWVKQRALAELDAGGPSARGNAIASFMSDLTKHPDTEGHVAIEFGIALLTHDTPVRELRRFIEGIN